MAGPAVFSPRRVAGLCSATVVVAASLFFPLSANAVRVLATRGSSGNNKRRAPSAETARLRLLAAAEVPVPDNSDDEDTLMEPATTIPVAHGDVEMAQPAPGYPFGGSSASSSSAAAPAPSPAGGSYAGASFLSSEFLGMPYVPSPLLGAEACYPTLEEVPRSAKRGCQRAGQSRPGTPERAQHGGSKEDILHRRNPGLAIGGKRAERDLSRGQPFPSTDLPNGDGGDPRDFVFFEELVNQRLVEVYKDYFPLNLQYTNADVARPAMAIENDSEHKDKLLEIQRQLTQHGRTKSLTLNNMWMALGEHLV
ncbi:unnamed protein product [Amoebophrya sp. A120]|nr:unnamed protein product [Amoebophrya sp. A120]|eukprot:GSA120T00021175001.1